MEWLSSKKHLMNAFSFKFKGYIVFLKKDNKSQRNKRRRAWSRFRISVDMNTSTIAFFIFNLLPLRAFQNCITWCYLTRSRLLTVNRISKTPLLLQTLFQNTNIRNGCFKHSTGMNEYRYWYYSIIREHTINTIPCIWLFKPTLDF